MTNKITVDRADLQLTLDTLLEFVEDWGWGDTAGGNLSEDAYNRLCDQLASESPTAITQS